MKEEPGMSWLVPQHESLAANSQEAL